jgi:predicted DNA-binding antitoxin AbrB/MazE fold protein
MAVVVEATYENGVLKPERPLPLAEHEKVRLTIEPEVNWVDQAYGILGWTGNIGDLRYLAEDVDLDPQEGA